MLRMRDYIKAQVEQSQGHFDAARARLESFKKQAQIEALRRDVDTALGQRGTLLPLLVEIQSEKARLAKAEEQLANRAPTGMLKRTIDSDPALMEAARDMSVGKTGLLGLETKNEYVNNVYDTIDQQVATIRTRLSGLERQKAELIDVRKLDSSQLSLLNTLYTREAELMQFQTDFDLARSAFIDVATRYEQVRTQVAGRSAQLQLMDTALPPDRPIGPKRVRNTAAAVVVGLILGAIGALCFSAVASARARQQIGT
jgi:uncharacterized protein involved in exopolysaccharide biosynthesis